MVKKVLAIVFVVVLFITAIPLTREPVIDWFTSVFSGGSDKENNTTTPNETENPTDSTDPTGTENPTTSTDPTDGKETEDEVSIADLPEEERLAAILKKLEEIATREDGDNVYTQEEGMLLTMHIVLDEAGNIVESGHNMAAPGVETYPLSEYPGGWNWTETTDVVKIPLFLSGHMLSVAQSQVVTIMEYVPVDDKNLEIAVCKHGDSLLSGYFVRTQGDLTIVNFDVESFSALESIIRWWYETDESGKQVVKIGFAFCNDAPEGVEAIPIIMPSSK